MFAPSYFAPTYFAPVYFPPGADQVTEQPGYRPGIGGGSFRRRLKKPKSFMELLSLQSDTGEFELEIPPQPVEESPQGMQQEVERFESAIEILQAQESQVEAEIDLLATQAELELLIRREILIRDLLAAREFILDLQEQAEILRLIKRRRQEEEAIIMAILMDDGNMNIKVH